jgi:hypothetical protein
MMSTGLRYKDSMRQNMVSLSVEAYELRIIKPQADLAEAVWGSRKAPPGAAAAGTHAGGGVVAAAAGGSAGSTVGGGSRVAVGGSNLGGKRGAYVSASGDDGKVN